MPAFWKWINVSPRTEVLPPVTTRPLIKALLPSIEITGAPAYPGCVEPSIVASSVTFGSWVATVIVLVPAGGMLNSMYCRPGLELDVLIAPLRLQSAAAPVHAVRSESDVVSTISELQASEAAHS